MAVAWKFTRIRSTIRVIRGRKKRHIGCPLITLIDANKNIRVYKDLKMFQFAKIREIRGPKKTYSLSANYAN